MSATAERAGQRVRFAIADPPYPPQVSERYDTVDGRPRIGTRSRARRWYGDGPRDRGGQQPADFHPAAGEWADDPLRTYMPQVPDVLRAAPPGAGFAGAKPERWTRWVLDALGYDPTTDELEDLFPGSGAVARAAAQDVLL